MRPFDSLCGLVAISILGISSGARAAGPSTPEGLIGVPLSTTQIELSWTASTDDVGVASYRVLRDGMLQGLASSTRFIDIGLTEGATHAYTVEAVDGDANLSAPSAAEIVTTLESTDPTWFNAVWQYRIPITVEASGVERVDRPVETDLDFSAALATLGAAGALDLDSLKVVRANASGQVLDSDVPFQFDPVAGFDAATHAVGRLTLLAAGTMGMSGSRYYDVYFDVQGESFTAPVFAPQVEVISGVMDEGQTSLQIDTDSGSYFYQEQGAGFSSVVDPDGNDWVSYTPGGGSAGEYRGIPNLTYPAGDFHPGATSGVTTLVHEGPLRAEIESETLDGLWRVRWVIYPDSAKMTVELADGNYWFLYEGTPGGTLETGVDFLIHSDGTSIPMTVKQTTDLAADEWVYFGDPNVDRALFVAHHSDDAHADLYQPLDDVMAILGFGRFKTNSLLVEVPNTFSVGLIDRTDHPEVQRLVRSAIEPITVDPGLPEALQAMPAVPTGAPILVVLALMAAGTSMLRRIQRKG
jgi:hypothetical protein